MEKDFLQKRYLSDNERYADLINGFLFAGRQVVSAGHLTELDTQTGDWRLPGFIRKSRKGRQKYRDLIRKTAFGVNFAVIGVESHTEVFQTDLKQVFDFIRCSNDKEKLRELVEHDPAYKEMEEDAYEAAAVFTGAKELLEVERFHEEGGKVNMCQALTALIADGRSEGRILGRDEGRILGRNEGRMEGQLEEILRIIRKMSEKGLGAFDISKLLDKPEDDIERMIALLESSPEKSNHELAQELMMK